MVERVDSGVDLIVFVPVGEVVQLTEKLMIPVGLDDGHPPVVVRRRQLRGLWQVARLERFSSGEPYSKLKYERCSLYCMKGASDD